MKANIFVIISSVFFASWLGVSFVTSLKPEQSLGTSFSKTTAAPKVKMEQSKPLVRLFEKTEISANTK